MLCIDPIQTFGIIHRNLCHTLIQSKYVSISFRRGAPQCLYRSVDTTTRPYRNGHVVHVYLVYTVFMDHFTNYTFLQAYLCVYAQ